MFQSGGIGGLLKLPSLGGLQRVTRSPDSPQATRVRGVPFNLAAKPSHAGVDAARFHIVPPPDGIQQLLSREHPVLILRKIIQKPELEGGGLYFSAANRNPH